MIIVVSRHINDAVARHAGLHIADVSILCDRDAIDYG